MLTLLLTRHGLTTRSTPEQHLGQRLDVPLDEAGRSQAAALAARLAPIAFDRVISSPLLRARQTVDAVLAASTATPQPAVEIDPRLLEMDYGDWEGLTYEQINERDREERRRWEADPASNACPNGESGDDVAVRARAFLADLLADDTDRRVLAVAHSTLDRVLLCVALGIPVREFRRRLVQSQVNLTVVTWATGAPPDQAELLLLNDVAHVRQPPELPWE
jgi:broad specificity phosphatase PhoE